jgi:hypothetical protein
LLEENFRSEMFRSDVKPAALERNRTTRDYSGNNIKTWAHAKERKRSGRKELTALELQGSRSRARPRRISKTTIEEEALKEGETWNEVKNFSENRVRWRHCVDTLCQSQE